MSRKTTVYVYFAIWENQLSTATMVYNFRVFKKCSPNGKITLYLGKRDFVDHISGIEPIGKK